MRRSGLISPARIESARRCCGRWRREMTVHVVKVPDIGEGIAEVELVEWRVRPGDRVEADQPLADVMTDKATVEVPSPVAGKVIAAHGKAGDKLAVGSELVRLETASASAPEAEEHAEAPEVSSAQAAVAPASTAPRSATPHEEPPASPSLRRHARELDVDLSQVR